MKKVLYVLEAVEGGAWRHLRDLIDTVHGTLCECHAALSFSRCSKNSAAAVRAFLTERGVALCELPVDRSASPADIGAIFSLRRLMRELAPDIVHLHSAKAGFLGRCAAAPLRLPVVYTPHCLPVLMTASRFTPVYRLLERHVAPHTSAIIVLSREEQRAALELGYDQGTINYIPNGIRSCNLPLPAVCESESLKLGFFGRAAPQKGLDTFVRLVKELNRRGISSAGMIFGVSRAQATLGKSEKFFIEYAGCCSPEMVVSRMRDCDVIVIPSRWEGLPYVLLEALDAGVPVSAYKVGGIGDVVEHDVSAMLAPPGDFEALLENTATLRDTALRRKIAKSARTTAAPYTLERMIEATLNVYQNV
jgi:glycosyltransferase involved in cell wall biosynthesis